jgi:hypothetical protein
MRSTQLYSQNLLPQNELFMRVQYWIYKLWVLLKRVVVTKGRWSVLRPCMLHRTRSSIVRATHISKLKTLNNFEQPEKRIKKYGPPAALVIPFRGIYFCW